VILCYPKYKAFTENRSLSTYNRDVIVSDCSSLISKLGHEKLERFARKSVLVLGANGLVGGFLADFFTQLNDTLGLDVQISLSSLSEPDQAERIQFALNREDVKYFSWDLSKPVPAEMLGSYDFVFFCAGYGQPKKFIKNKMGTIFLNTVGLDSLLDHCSDQDKECNFVYLSSSEIYGNPDPENIPTSESYNGNYSVESNRACYISAKRLGEVICLERGRTHSNLKTKIIRLALAYGPGVLSSDDRVMQEFMFRAIKESKISLLDSGDALRNYIYISDCVEMLINICLDGNESIYNVGSSGDQVSILQLAEKIASLFEAEVTCGSKKSDAVVAAPNRVALDLSKYNSEFGIVADPIDLNDGLRRLRKWLSV